MDAENVGRTFSCCLVTIDALGVLGVRRKGWRRAPFMGDYRQNLLNHRHSSEAEDSLGREQNDDPLGLQNPVFESLRSTDLTNQDLDDGELGFEDPEEEPPPEEVTEEELIDAQEPGEALPEVERAPEKDEDEGVTEMRWVWGVGPPQVGVGLKH